MDSLKDRIERNWKYIADEMGIPFEVFVEWHKEYKQLLKDLIVFSWDKGYLGASGKVTMGKHQIKRDLGLID